MKAQYQTLEELFQSAGVDLEKRCGRLSAVNAFRKKLSEEFGVSHFYLTSSGVHSLFDRQLLVHRDDVRDYLWGVEVLVHSAKKKTKSRQPPQKGRRTRVSDE